MSDAFSDPTLNPDASNAAVQALFNDSDTGPAPTIAPQPDGFVRLPGGLVRGLDVNEVAYDAEVRELTGADEEYIDRVRRGRGMDRFVEAVLERGVVEIGGQPVTKAVINELLLGDAQFLLNEVRRATYGEEIEFTGFRCPGCNEELEVTIDVADIPVHPLKDTSERFFEVPLRKGAKAHVRIPRFSDLVDNTDTTPAEARTLLLSRVVLSIEDKDGNFTPVAGSSDAARALGLADRNSIINSLGKRTIGPAYNEVKFTHEGSCGEEVPFPVSVGDLFPDM